MSEPSEVRAYGPAPPPTPPRANAICTAGTAGKLRSRRWALARPPGVIDIPETPADVPYGERRTRSRSGCSEHNGLPTHADGLLGLLD